MSTIAQAAALAALAAVAKACTNLIVTPEATVDGSTIFSYSADSGSLYGTLGQYPAGNHAPGTMRKLYDWDSGVYLGEIPEAPVTYNVIGNLNEHGLAIGETTFGGNGTLSGGAGVMDYGNLIWVTLQRTKTAREAIAMFHNLTTEYGYVSEGESFTIADSTEVWVLELIGKGHYEKGAVWVARRIPKGYVSGHANQARIQTFPQDDPENCVYSPDVISFAAMIGLWDSSRDPKDFSFSDTYDPITFSGARQSDARVWSFFSQVAEDPDFEKHYANYVLGKELHPSARMPLFVKPKGKLSVHNISVFMRNHFEGMVLDPTKDVGAEHSRSPFRVRPIVWTHGNDSYVNERTVGVQQTGWNFIAQLRGWMPASIGGRLWFAVDDATFSVHTPFHGGTSRVPKCLADGNGDALHWTPDSAFWVFNAVANFVYPRWQIAPEVIDRALKSESQIEEELAAEEAVAQALWERDPAAAVEHLTKWDVDRAEKVTKDEMALFGELMVKYRDGFKITDGGPNAPNHGGIMGGVVPNVAEVGYSAQWEERIIKDTGKHYLMTDSHTHPDLAAWKLRALNKGVASRGAQDTVNAIIV